jgi:hypothetical protein
MATKTEEPRALKEVNRQVREALQDCEKLLERSAFLLRESKQDNDPPNPS